MRFIILFSILSSALFLLYSCNANKHVLEEYDGPKLHFGNGGGFIGLSKEYILLPNGQLFFRMNEDPFAPLEKGLKKKNAKKIFQQADELKLIDIDHNSPGNRYFFMQYEKDQQKNKMMWGKEPNYMHQNLDSLYLHFMHQVRGLNIHSQLPSSEK